MEPLTLEDKINAVVRAIRIGIDMPCFMCEAGRFFANDDGNPECILCLTIIEVHNDGTKRLAHPEPKDKQK